MCVGRHRPEDVLSAVQLSAAAAERQGKAPGWMWGAELGVSATPTGWAGPVISCCCRRPRYPAGPGCGGLGVGGCIMGELGVPATSRPRRTPRNPDAPLCPRCWGWLCHKGTTRGDGTRGPQAGGHGPGSGHLGAHLQLCVGAWFSHLRRVMGLGWWLRRALVAILENF